jgi:hypothetical protein
VFIHLFHVLAAGASWSIMDNVYVRSCPTELIFSLLLQQIVDWIEATYGHDEYKQFSCKTYGNNPFVGAFFIDDADHYCNSAGFPSFEAMKQNIILLDSILLAAPHGLPKAAKRRLFCDFRPKYKDKDAAAIVALLAAEG